MLDRIGIFPFAAVVATIIFLAREVLEGVRRLKANNRKLRAVKAFVAADCERNHYVVKWMRGTLPAIREAINNKKSISIMKDIAGKNRIRLVKMETNIPRTYTNAIDKYLFESASLDSDLFELMREVLSDILELQHLCDGLVENVSNDQYWLMPWTDYAESELDEIVGSLYRLYVHCTGEDLVSTRLR
jgi:hypothetical protein